MSAVPPAAGVHGPAVLLIENGAATLFTVDRRERRLGRRATFVLGDTGDGRSSDAARALGERLAPMLAENGIAKLALGLPVAWTEQVVLETPPLRGLDLLGLVQREVVRQTHLPSNDILLAHVDEGASAKSDSRTSLRLVSAARESAVLALVHELARRGIAVVSVAAAPLIALLHAIDEFAHTAGVESEPQAIVLARQFGFAVGVHVGRRVVQLRVVGVSVPSDPESLATVLTEEVRRSCMFFRERSRGQDVRSVHVVGHVASDAESVRKTLEAALGMPAIVDACDGADLTLEAHAMLALATRRKFTHLELLPTELGRRHAGKLRGFAAVALVLTTIGLSGLTAKRCGDEARHTQSEVTRIAAERMALEGEVARHADAMVAVQEHITRRDYVQTVITERVDLAAFLAEISSAMPGIARITAVRARGCDGEDPVVEVHGCVAAGDFESDECVHTLMAHVTRELGASCRLIELSAAPHGRDERFEFVFEAAWAGSEEDVDESS